MAHPLFAGHMKQTTHGKQQEKHTSPDHRRAEEHFGFAQLLGNRSTDHRAGDHSRQDRTVNDRKSLGLHLIGLVCHDDRQSVHQQTTPHTA